MKSSIILLAVVAALSSCNQQSNSGDNGSGTENSSGQSTEPAKDVPVDLIQNPSTASDPSAQSNEYAEMTFKVKDHDFGDIIENQNVETTYKFTNTGKAPLLITECKATCGCTVPDWPKDPIKPGESGSIKVVFNSSGKSGVNNKIVTVVSNAREGNTELKFRANVLAIKKTEE